VKLFCNAKVNVIDALEELEHQGNEGLLDI
jgi:hypothetical protein